MAGKTSNKDPELIDGLDQMDEEENFRLAAGTHGGASYEDAAVAEWQGAGQFVEIVQGYGPPVPANLEDYGWFEMDYEEAARRGH